MYTNSKVVLSMDGTLFATLYNAHASSVVVLGVALVTTLAQYSLVPLSSEASSNTVLHVQCTQGILL